MKIAPLRIRKVVDESWYSGEAEVLTMAKEYMAATKLAALFSRRKGRDMFDFGIYWRELQVRPEDVADYLEHLKMNEPRMKRWTSNTAKQTMRDHLVHRDFQEDLDSITPGWRSTTEAERVVEAHSRFAERVHEILLERKEQRRRDAYDAKKRSDPPSS